MKKRPSLYRVTLEYHVEVDPKGEDCRDAVAIVAKRIQGPRPNRFTVRPMKPPKGA